MNGFWRSYYAALEAIAQQFAERRADQAGRWNERARRWGAKARPEAARL